MVEHLVKERGELITVGSAHQRRRFRGPLHSMTILQHGRCAMGKHLLGRREFTDGDGSGMARLKLVKLGVNPDVVLSVITDEDPFNVREVTSQLAQSSALVVYPRTEPSGVRRAPVGQQQRPLRIPVAGQKPYQKWVGIPRASRCLLYTSDAADE
mgnify:FL=1